MMARDMVPGKTYMGTADGPELLDGIFFTPLIIVTASLEGVVPTNGPDPDRVLLQVQYDAWAYPLHEVTFFAPADWVLQAADEDCPFFGWDRRDPNVDECPPDWAQINCSGVLNEGSGLCESHHEAQPAVCTGSGHPLRIGACCSICGVSFGFPDPGHAGKVVGSPAPQHTRQSTVTIGRNQHRGQPDWYSTGYGL